MKTDRYTKIILTVIAACLIVNILEKIDIIPKAYANGSEKATPLNSNYAVVPVNEDGSINVTVNTTTPMDVNLVRISTNDDLDVNVNIEKIGGRYVYGEIPVTVKQ
ncbi:hypothetical protein DVK85_01975 [Flavobacterium arcticum]|uniref:Uncharacterized protein n=1 Tax=Flavobacterium arcticum TaxID=1784713 RepID=A0A345H903_9FLAO|nr:hypothetical protein [Flavobacterium arcticum]AXG73063.1 hypothetical protein DVK85_01975 [Flavobacterium arcticum]KAF2512855.1 hypothetical protein E0W72_00045 [Flavobacterium arcticum]